MDPATLVRRRLRAQRLTGAGHPTPVDAVRRSGAVQAQELAEARWSVVQRTGGAADDAAVQAALDAGELLRTHVLRQTWHLVAAEDLRWLQRLTAPRVHVANRPQYRRNDLDAATFARTDALLVEALADGAPRTRPELAVALSAAGVEAAGERLAHVVMHAELEALLVSGPRRGVQHTYVLAEGRVPAAPERSREDDLTELARRYLRSHGPAGPRDLAWWASLTVGDATAAIGLSGADEVAPGLWAPADAEAPPRRQRGRRVLLLGMYDELGVATRDVKLVHAADPPPVGQLERAVLLDGLVVGTWRRTLTARRVALGVRLFVPLDADARDELQLEAERFAASLRLELALELAQIA